MIGPGSLAVIGVVAVIIFGPKKLPELGKAAGTRFVNLRTLLRD